MFGMKKGRMRYHLFLATMFLNPFIFPHDIPTMAKRTPLNPSVGTSPYKDMAGKNDAMMAMGNETRIYTGHLIIHKHKILTARWKMFAWHIG